MTCRLLLGLRPRLDQDGAEVIDIRKRRPGDDRIPQRTKEAVTIVV